MGPEEVRRIMSTGYDCPTCGWSYDDEGYYYVENGTAIKCDEGCKEYGNGAFEIIPYPPIGFKVYPVYSNQRENIGASMEFGGSPVDWKETHLCPNCNTEFMFTDGNY